MIVLDASVVIAELDVHDALHGAAVALLAGQVSEPLALHVVTRAEVLVAPTRAGRAAEVEQRLDALEIATIGLPADEASELARIRAQTSLRLPDCCVLLAATRHGAALATFDHRMARAASGLGAVVLGTHS